VSDTTTQSDDSNKLFDRVYRLLVGKKGDSKGLEITELRIQFEIEKTAKKNPNKSSIKIYNLTRATREMLEKPDTRCVLYAGYKNGDGALLLFQGAVTFAWSKYDLPDIVTEFELGDGAPEIRDTTISVGYDKGIKSTQVLNDVAKKMGTPLTLPSDAPTRVWANGLSHHGSARSLLDKVTKGTGLEWSIQNGNLQVIKSGMVTTRQGIVLSADSGLIGSPERERKSKDGTAEVTDTSTKKVDVKKAQKHYDGWSVKTLLLPQLNPGDRVKLEARDVNGIFRIQELKHRGDSDASGDWQTEMKLIDPALPLTDPKAAKGGHAKRGHSGGNGGGE
jgi:hypothetical protein